MNTTLATTAPTFHALTGAQPVGQTQVATMAEYVGTITTVARKNDTYWVVATRDARNAFRGPWNAVGTTAQIWMDPTTMEFVVDYWEGTTCVEADRTRTLKAAIGVAADVTAQRWLARR
jgi:hypothetical protein